MRGQLQSKYSPFIGFDEWIRKAGMHDCVTIAQMGTDQNERCLFIPN